MVVNDVLRQTLHELDALQEPEASAAGRRTAFRLGAPALVIFVPHAVAEALPEAPRRMMEHVAASTRHADKEAASRGHSRHGRPKWPSDMVREAAGSRVLVGLVAAARPLSQKEIGKRQ